MTTKSKPARRDGFANAAEAKRARLGFKEGDTVAGDFFGASVGIVRKIGRKFIHVDVGVRILTVPPSRVEPRK
jgi:hypothetical protein